MLFSSAASLANSPLPAALRLAQAGGIWSSAGVIVEPLPSITFLGEIRRAAGRATLHLEAGTVGGLLGEIGRAISPEFAALLCGGATLQPDVEVLVNGRNIELLEGLDTPLRPADQVTIFLSGLRGFPGG